MREKSIQRKQYLKFLLFYTVLFCVAFGIIFYPFIVSGKSFVWNSDAQGQYLPNLYYLYNNIIDLFTGKESDAFSGFSFSAGLGADVTNLYFKGILDYLGVFLGKDNIEGTFRLIILLRLYFSGLSFGALAFYWKQSIRSMIPGALIYVFSGFTLYYGMRHMSFLIPVIILPILIIGIEKIIRGESAILFSLCVFYSAWTDYYFLYINTLILGVYVCVRWIEDKNFKKSVKDFGRIFLYYCIGIGLSAVSLFPRIYKLFISNRASTVTIDAETLLTYGKNWIMQFVTRLISPYTTSEYTRYYMLYAVAAIIILAIVVLFFLKEKKYRKLKAWVLMGTIFFFVPVFAFIFSGFNSLVNRWGYAYSLLVAMVVTVVLPEMEELKEKLLIVIVGVIGLICMVVMLNPEVGEWSTRIGICMLSGSFVMILFAGYQSKKSKDSLIFYEIVILAVMINIGVNGQCIFSKGYGNFVTEFVNTGKALDKYEKSAYASENVIEDEGFYRVETEEYNQNLANAPKLWEIAGTSSYDSTLPGTSVEFNSKLQNRGQYTSVSFYGFDNRSWLETLGGVGYYITTSDEESTIPYGFGLYKTEKQKDGTIKYIYKNKYMLPIGYTYDSYLQQSEVEELGVLDLQQKMLQSAVIADDSDLSKDLEKDKEGVGTTTEEIKYELEKNKDIIWNGKNIEVKKDNASLTIRFQEEQNAETYLILKGCNIDEVSDSSFSINIKKGNIQKSIWAFSSKDKYRIEDYEEYCINLGYNEESRESTCSIIFPYAGTYKLDSLELYSVNMKEYPQYIKQLKKNSLQNVEVRKDVITGEIQLNKTKLLCTMIPYSKFWHVYVDGKEVETECINYMWMATPINAGKHIVEFRYHNEALRIGMCVSILTLLLLIGWSFLKYKKKKVM